LIIDVGFLIGMVDDGESFASPFEGWENPQERVKTEAPLKTERLKDRGMVPLKADGTTKIPVLYADPWCIIVNKPNNMLVHHSHYARNIETPSLVELLREQTGEDLVPVHRLDHKTSGVLLLVRDREHVPAFQELFASKAIEKKYHALLRGFVAESGTIETPVKNERGNHKEAFTRFRCLAQYEVDFAIAPYPKARYSLVEMIPETGRLHQLRIHANKISHPIIGDPKHGNRHHNHYFQQELGIPYLFLHAEELGFVHPFAGEEVKVRAEKPEFWKHALKIFVTR
jgi:tRNA pseudouridine65 synthase